MDNIGNKVKSLRLSKGMTLKELSEKTGISIGFLSQFERDQGTIAIDSLQTISDVFEVDITYFLASKNVDKSPIVRSYGQNDMQIINTLYISRMLVNDVESAAFLPRIVEILPSKSVNDEPSTQTHNGVEFIYVLEGVLDLIIDNELYSLHPGDSAYFESTKPHNWINNTTRIVKILSINSPNTFKV